MAQYCGCRAARAMMQAASKLCASGAPVALCHARVSQERCSFQNSTGREASSKPTLISTGERSPLPPTYALYAKSPHLRATNGGADKRKTRCILICAADSAVHNRAKFYAREIIL